MMTYTLEQVSQMLDILTGRVAALDGRGLPKGVPGLVPNLQAQQTGSDTKIRQVVTTLQSQLSSLQTLIAGFMTSVRPLLGLPLSTPLPGPQPWLMYTAQATQTVDFALATSHRITLVGPTTLNLTNGHSGIDYSVILVQDSTGNHPVTWGPMVYGISGSGLEADKSSTFNFIFDGTNFLAQGGSLINM